MVNVQNIHSLTEFKRNANSYIETIRSTKAPIVITVNGEAAVVVQDAIEYQALIDRLDVARSATVIQQRHAQYLKDGIEFDEIEALENLRGELKELKEQRNS